MANFGMAVLLLDVGWRTAERRLSCISVHEGTVLVKHKRDTLSLRALSRFIASLRDHFQEQNAFLSKVMFFPTAIDCKMSSRLPS
jgi:hypothetical protein